MGNPRAVVLDELTTGLDPRARRDTREPIEDIRAILGGPEAEKGAAAGGQRQTALG